MEIYLYIRFILLGVLAFRCRLRIYPCLCWIMLAKLKGQRRELEMCNIILVPFVF